MSALDHDRGQGASFRLDKANGKLMGVCSGIAKHFDVDPTLVRVAFVRALCWASVQSW